MNMHKFHTIMTSLDDDLLEEAKQPLPKKKHTIYWYSLAAACLLLAIVLHFPFRESNTTTASDLHAQGYDLHVPEDADPITYSLYEETQPPTAMAVFSLHGDEYTYHVTKCSQSTTSYPQASSDTVLSWSTKGLDLSMTKTNSTASINWYSPSANTNHTLSTTAGDDKLLSTTRQVLLLTGLDVANAPAEAETIRYSVFHYQDLVVAETTFLYKNNTYSYRMAATSEVSEDYADISEMNDDFSITVPGEVAYCPAQISLSPNAHGKIIWFDVVPGIVYSLATENNASEATLLSLANELFEPMQGTVE